MSAGRAIVGAALVAVGALFLLDAGGVVEAGDTLRRWWPLLLVVLGLLQAVSERRFGWVATVLVVSGLLLLTVSGGLFGEGAWGVLWPSLFIVAGLWVLAGWGRGRDRRGASREVATLSLFNLVRLVNRSVGFRSGTLTALFGGIRLDLTRATLDPGGARISATAVFGSIDVIVPSGWGVEVRGLPIFGGWDDTTSRLGITADSPRLAVQVLVLFGGVEVKHPERWRG
jgi:predicted membrane protein